MAKLKGWYYDKQLGSPLTSASLHANCWWDKDQEKFINWNLIKGDNGFGSNGNKCDLDKFETILGAATGACGYGRDPICTSILSEDFSVAISNTWTEFGGDPIAQAWNDFRGPFSGVAKTFINSLNTLYKNNKEAMEKYEDQFSKFGSFMTNLIDHVGDRVVKLENGKDIDVVSFLNKALITSGTRFSYYGGTGISFGNLSMKFTLFPMWKDGNFIGVTEQVDKLYPYFIGQLEDFASATNTSGADPEGTTLPDGVVKEVVNNCFMFQRPPGGYETEMKDIDIVQKGTLKLKIGNFYEIANLVCSDIMLNFSKNMVKNPKEGTLSPLFCDVAISLRPPTKFSDKSLRKFVGGNSELTNRLSRVMKSNIDREKKMIEENFRNNKYIIDQDV